jgi:hypothetical protein
VADATVVKVAQVWADLDPRHEGRQVEVVELAPPGEQYPYALVALLTGRTWPGHRESNRPGDDRRAEPGRLTRVSLDAFLGATGPSRPPRYQLVQEPGDPCAYCRRLSTTPAEDGMVCECDRWCGSAHCCDHPEARAREIGYVQLADGERLPAVLRRPSPRPRMGVYEWGDVDRVLAGVLVEVADERARQDEKWGEQNHPDGTGPDWRLAGCPATVLLDMVRRDLDRSLNDTARFDVDSRVEIAAPAGPTWLLIALEEMLEAFVEADQVALRGELVQAAAVLVAWIQKIDRDAAKAVTG